jgi:hypothetical protein
MIEHRGHTCGRSRASTLCEHGNIERILRLDHHEECPFWIPEPEHGPHERFVNEVERKCDECGM